MRPRHGQVDRDLPVGKPARQVSPSDGRLQPRLQKPRAALRRTHSVISPQAACCHTGSGSREAGSRAVLAQSDRWTTDRVSTTGIGRLRRESLSRHRSSLTLSPCCDTFARNLVWDTCFVHRGFGFVHRGICMEMVTRDGVLLSEESNVVSDTSYTRAQAKRSDQPSERGLNCAMRRV